VTVFQYECEKSFNFSVIQFPYYRKTVIPL